MSVHASQILNLPKTSMVNLRDKFENICVLAMSPGPHAPKNYATLLACVINELIALDTDGFAAEVLENGEPTAVTVRARLAFVMGDSPGTHGPARGLRFVTAAGAFAQLNRRSCVTTMPQVFTAACAVRTR
jgi:hypothetical protein